MDNLINPVFGDFTFLANIGGSSSAVYFNLDDMIGMV